MKANLKALLFLIAKDKHVHNAVLYDLKPLHAVCII